MPIALVTTPGDAIYREKINEIIAAINQLQGILGTGNIPRILRVTCVSGVESYVSPGLEVTLSPSAITIDFDEAFTDAGAYAAVCAISPIGGNDSGFAFIQAKSASSITFSLVSDDGTGGVGSPPGYVDVIMISNVGT